MQDAFAHCEALVRAADRDRYLATLFAPADRRDALFALYAFDAEIARVRDLAREPLAGEIRRQWWREVLAGERPGEAAASPIAAALLQTVARHDLPPAALVALIEARGFDLDEAPMPTFSALASYADAVRGTILRLAARILGATPDELDGAANPAAVAQIHLQVLAAMGRDVAGAHRFMPTEALDRHGARRENLLNRQATPPVAMAFAEMTMRARELLALASGALRHAGKAVLPAFLPLATVRPLLDRLERAGPFRPAELSGLRRQWLIWRAARQPRRIAG
jgi:phytoene synthase